MTGGIPPKWGVVYWAVGPIVPGTRLAGVICKESGCRDMKETVGVQSGAAGPERPVVLSRAEFSGHFQASSRALWCVAAGLIGDRAEADDIVQQAALVALERLDDFDARGSFLAWMVQIVKYTALNERRKRQRRKTAATDPVGMDMAHAAPGGGAGRAGPILTSRGAVVPGQESFDDDVLKALDTLEETARACLLLRTVMDMPYREVSLALDIPEGTAMSHVHRARKTMRDRLTAAGRDR
jgi:RNA polymerase sigma-70 factor, ECF subfamily